jgi:hypothetical protein
MRPKFVHLASLLNCPFPPRLRLNYSDLGAWPELALLSVRPAVLHDPDFAAGQYAPSPTASTLEALRTGNTPATEVPRVAGTATAPMFLSSQDLLRVLTSLGYLDLPILATRPAAKYLRMRFAAADAPAYWRLSDG